MVCSSTSLQIVCAFHGLLISDAIQNIEWQSASFTLNSDDLKIENGAWRQLNEGEHMCSI